MSTYINAIQKHYKQVCKYHLSSLNSLNSGNETIAYHPTIDINRYVYRQYSTKWNQSMCNLVSSPFETFASANNSSKVTLIARNYSSNATKNDNHFNASSASRESNSISRDESEVKEPPSASLLRVEFPDGEKSKKKIIPKLGKRLFGWNSKQVDFLLETIPMLNYSKRNFLLVSLLAFQHPLYATMLKTVFRNQMKSARQNEYYQFLQKEKDKIMEYARENGISFVKASNIVWKKYPKSEQKEAPSKKIKRRTITGFQLFVIDVSPKFEGDPKRGRKLVQIAEAWSQLPKEEKLIYQIMAEDLRVTSEDFIASSEKTDDTAPYLKLQRAAIKRQEELAPILESNGVFSGDVNHSILDLDRVFPDRGILNSYMEFIKKEKEEG